MSESSDFVKSDRRRFIRRVASVGVLGGIGSLLLGKGIETLPQVTALGGVQTLFVSTSIKSINNTATENSIIGAGVGSKTLPANFLSAGKTIRVTLRGRTGQNGNATAITLRLKLGTTVIVQTSFTPGGSSAPFSADGIITCLTSGVQGKVLSAFAESHNTSPVTINTTQPLVLDVTEQYGIISIAGWTVDCTHFIIEAL
jgi:hypothetical protein